MESKSRVDPRIYLAMYCLIFFCNGMVTGSMGPIIPYLSKDRNVPQPQYYIIFMARTVGSVIAFIAYKYILFKQHREVQHKIMASCGLFAFVASFILMWWETKFGQFLSFAIFGGAHFAILVTGKLCLIQIAKEKAGSWIPLTNGNFGLGALFSPLLIRFGGGVNAYYFIAVTFFTSMLLLFYYPSPMKKEESLIEKAQQKDKNEFTYASMKLEILFSLAFVFMIGVEGTASGWLPSYAVMTGVMNKDDAAMCGTIFWIASTTLRFVVAGSSSIKCSVKLRMLLIMIVCCSTFCLVLHLMGFYWFNAIFGSIGFGVSVSAVFPLLISVPLEFKLKFRPQQLSNILFSPFFGTMLLTGSTGMLMQISIDFLFYSLLACGIILWYDSVVFFKQMKLEQELNITKDEQMRTLK